MVEIYISLIFNTKKIITVTFKKIYIHDTIAIDCSLMTNNDQNLNAPSLSTRSAPGEQRSHHRHRPLLSHLRYNINHPLDLYSIQTVTGNIDTKWHVRKKALPQVRLQYVDNCISYVVKISNTLQNNYYSQEEFNTTSLKMIFFK